MSEETLKRIEKQIQSHSALLYMKGSPLFPQCGFSAQVAHILQELNLDFSYVNILSHPDIRSQLPHYAQWPTFPQLWLNGELIGGCDIITEMFQSNELQELLEKSGLKHEGKISQVED